jgi:hypothetical protein
LGKHIKIEKIISSSNLLCYSNRIYESDTSVEKVPAHTAKPEA